VFASMNGAAVLSLTPPELLSEGDGECDRPLIRPAHSCDHTQPPEQSTLTCGGLMWIATGRNGNRHGNRCGRPVRSLSR